MSRVCVSVGPVCLVFGFAEVCNPKIKIFGLLVIPFNPTTRTFGIRVSLHAPRQPNRRKQDDKAWGRRIKSKCAPFRLQLLYGLELVHAVLHPSGVGY